MKCQALSAPSFKGNCPILVCALVAAAFAAAAHGAMWTGGAGDMKMSTPGNWQDGAAPTLDAAQDITLDFGHSTITNDIGALPVGALMR
jgi:hypothetical protein